MTKRLDILSLIDNAIDRHEERGGVGAVLVMSRPAYNELKKELGEMKFGLSYLHTPRRLESYCDRFIIIDNSMRGRRVRLLEGHDGWWVD